MPTAFVYVQHPASTKHAHSHSTWHISVRMAPPAPRGGQPEGGTCSVRSAAGLVHDDHPEQGVPCAQLAQPLAHDGCGTDHQRGPELVRRVQACQEGRHLQHEGIGFSRNTGTVSSLATARQGCSPWEDLLEDASLAGRCSSAPGQRARAWIVLPRPISSPMMPPARCVCSSHIHFTPAHACASALARQRLPAVATCPALCTDRHRHRHQHWHRHQHQHHRLKQLGPTGWQDPALWVSRPQSQHLSSGSRTGG